MTETEVDALLGPSAKDVFLGVRTWCHYRSSPPCSIAFDVDVGAVHFRVKPPGSAELLGVDLFSLNFPGLEQFIQVESLATSRVYHYLWGVTSSRPLETHEEHSLVIKLTDLDIWLWVDEEYGVNLLEVRGPYSFRRFEDFGSDS